MTVACYCRVSPNGPSEATQRREIKRWLADERISPSTVLWFVDKHESSFSELNQLRADVSNGVVKTVAVFSLDRFGKLFQHCTHVLSIICESDIRIVVTSQNLDIRGGSNIASFVRAIAQMEVDLRREQQTTGILAGKKRGVFKGRKPGALKAGVNPSQAAELRAKGLTYNAIAEQMGVSQKTVVRYLTIK